MGYIQDEIKDAVGAGWYKAIIIIAVLVGVWIVFSLVFGFWPFSVVGGVITKVTTPDAIITNYQWFYDQYNAIQAQKANVLAMQKDAPERIGMILVLNNAIAEYNSRSKQITRNLWKAEDLPYQIGIGGEF